jgi:competence protein ComEC
VLVFAEEKEHKINGKIFVYVRTQNLDVSKLDVGRYICVNSEIDFYSLQDKDLGKAVSKISDGVVGDCFAYAYQIKTTEDVSLTLKDKIKSWVLEKSTNYKNADIGYAMLFGDTSVLNPDTKGIFQESGTAHLLAVSGFHITLIVLMLSFVLNKLKAGRYVKIFAIGLILFVYGYLCDFSVSVLRAIIMSLLALYATARTKEYDGLSAVSLAAVIILLISPLQLFDVSFVLSFTSVLAIILIKPILTRFFSKIFYNKFASTLSLSLAVQVGLFITQLYYFKSVPMLSVLTNLITVPLASFAFMYYIVAIIVSWIIPLLSPIMLLFESVMTLILRFNNLIAGITISADVVSAAVLGLAYLLMFVVSDYVFVRQRWKSVLSLIIFVVMTCLIII